MMSSRRIAALVAALTLALPAGALAQGAGDNQYQDPFAGEDSGSGSGGGGGGGGAEGTNGDGSPSDSPPSGEQLASQSTSSGELPRTGADPGLVGLLGAGLILTGAGLRVRVRRPIA
jgi:LPXTG-motif cell wall-anchored protein